MAFTGVYTSILAISDSLFVSTFTSCVYPGSGRAYLVMVCPRIFKRPGHKGEHFPPSSEIELKHLDWTV